MKFYTHFETENLILRATNHTDAAFVLELLNTPKWIKYIGDRNVKTVEDARQYIANKMQPQQERLGFSNYTVIRKSDNVKMGSCGLYDREGLEGIDIGFAFLPAYEGKGYAYEAAKVIRDFGLNTLGMESIQAITTVDNTASQKLLTKLGFLQTGETTLPGDTEKLMVYNIYRE